MEVNHLNPKLRDRYRIKNTHLPRVLQSPVGDIHFSKLTEEQAEKLCDANFRYLERIVESQEDGKSESPEAKVKVKKVEAAAEPAIVDPDAEAKPEVQE